MRTSRVGVLLALREIERNLLEQWPPQPPQSQITRQRSVRDARIHHRDGNPPAGALVDQVRPKLTFHKYEQSLDAGRADSAV